MPDARNCSTIHSIRHAIALHHHHVTGERGRCLPLAYCSAATRSKLLRPLDEVRVVLGVALPLDLHRAAPIPEI